MKSGKGYYNVNSKDVQIIRISDDIVETTTKVIVDNQEVDFVYDADNKTITFILENSPAYGHPWAGHDIKVYFRTSNYLNPSLLIQYHGSHEVTSSMM